MATDYTRLPNTIGKPTEGELSVAEQEDGGLFDTGDGTTGVGAPGTEGPKGDTGDAGATGPQGDTGPQGPRGYQGVSIEGPTGPEGNKGDTGLTGDTGIDGATGPNGPKGDMGTSGTDGTDGSTGPTGPEGPKGDVGATGTSVTGPAGPQGPKGDTGDASTVVGPTGPPGVQGPTGSSGNEGPKGDMGTQGETGGVGPEGPQGVQGTTGMTGGTGSTGLTGATGPTGPEGNIGPTGARGTEGPKGQTGDKGDTGVQGSSGIGEKGATGATGPSGPEGDVGAQGERGPGGGDKGDKGDTGDTGPPGQDAQGAILTDAAIKVKYENNDNTNAFTDFDKDKLGAITDLTKGEVKTLYESNDDTNVFDDAAKTTLGTALQTHQDLTGYVGDWDSTRQYVENDLVDLGGIIYRNNQIFIGEGYSAGSNFMLIQTDNDVVTFIAEIKFEGNIESGAISINDDSVTNLGNGNYSVRIGHRLWSSTGVSQNTNSLSATRDEDDFTLRLDETATIGESPTTNPEYWERITTNSAEIAAIVTNTDAITANATAIGNITEGFEEYSLTKDTADGYAVNSIVWYKHNAGIGEEINLFWKFTDNIPGIIEAGVPTVDTGTWELMTLDNAERAAIVTNTDAITANATAITANATSITNIDIGNGTITIEQNGNSVGEFTTNQSENETIKLLDTTTTVINTTVVNNATEYVKDTFYALATQIKFTDTDGNVHYYEKYGEPGLYLGVWVDSLPYLTTRIVSHNGFYYVASGNGATPGQEPNTGATDGSGEQAWVLIDINPVDYSNTWKPLVPNHFEISANNGAATTATLNTLDIDGTNYNIPASIPWLDYLVGKQDERSTRRQHNRDNMEFYFWWYYVL